MPKKNKPKSVPKGTVPVSPANVPYNITDGAEGTNAALWANAQRGKQVKKKLKNVTKEYNQVGQELTNVQGQVGNLQRTIADESGNADSLSKLWTNVLDASYGANQDIIQQRAGMREALYGERGLNPANMDLLSQPQQENVRTANRAGLIAGIQALNETENARGQKVSDILEEQNKSAEARRQSLLDQAGLLQTESNILQQRQSLLGQKQQMFENKLTRIQTRKGQLESIKLEQRQANRSFALDTIKSYPALIERLSEKEINAINRGELSDALVEKINATVTSENAKAAQSANTTQVSFTDSAGNSYVIGVDKLTGKELFRTKLGNVGGSGRGGGGGGGSGGAGGKLTEAERKALGDASYFRTAGNITDPSTLQYFSRLDKDFQQYWVANQRMSPSTPYSVSDVAAAYDEWSAANSKGSTADTQAIASELQSGMNSGYTRTEAEQYLTSLGQDPEKWSSYLDEFPQ